MSIGCANTDSSLRTVSSIFKKIVSVAVKVFSLKHSPSHPSTIQALSDICFVLLKYVGDLQEGMSANKFNE